MSSYSFDIDPLAVLGVPADATLEQIRDAYRRKSKIHHPDVGGEDWAFKVLAQSYEILSTARVLRATRAEPSSFRSHAEAPPSEGRSTVADRQHHEPSAETVRGGIHDRDVPPERMVGLEHLCVRYLWDEAAYLWLSQKKTDEERFLSCSLNLSWPDQGLSAGSLKPKEVAAILGELGEIFDHMVVSTRVISSRSHADEEQFSGWLTYPSFDRSWKALKCLHDALRSRGLGLRQWSRDLYIPRKWG